MGMGFNSAVELLCTGGCTVVQLLYLEKKNALLCEAPLSQKKGGR